MTNWAKDVDEASKQTVSSGSSKAIAPVAEEVKRLTIFFDCGTS